MDPFPTAASHRRPDCGHGVSERPGAKVRPGLRARRQPDADVHPEIGSEDQDQPGTGRRFRVSSGGNALKVLFSEGRFCRRSLSQGEELEAFHRLALHVFNPERTRHLG